MYICVTISIAIASAVNVVNNTEYVFVQNLDRVVAISRGDITYYGKLDATGEFHETHRQEGGYGIGIAFILLNVGSLTPTKVYEFRSRTLIPGTMCVGGHFIPQIGGTIINFDDYKFSPISIPIWNLPGGFQKKSR